MRLYAGGSPLSRVPAKAAVASEERHQKATKEPIVADVS